MARLLLAGGLAIGLMGAAVIVPVAVASMEDRDLTALGIGVVSAGVLLMAGGLAASCVGLRLRRTSLMPPGVRVAVAANMVLLAFCALELSDRLVRQDGRIFYWTTFLLLPAALLYAGLVGARRWAWWTARVAFALGTLLFLAMVVFIPFGDLHGEGGPVPWYGRLYMIGVTLMFATIVGGAYSALGRLDTRKYFGLIQAGPECAASDANVIRHPIVAVMLALVLAASAQGQDVATGPEKRAKVPALKVFDATGTHKDKEVDYAADRAGKPTVYLFIDADKFDRPMNRFMKTLDGIVAKDFEGAYVVAVWLTSDADKTKAFLPRVQQSVQYEATALTLFTGAKEGPKGWTVNADAHLTAVVANKGKVAATFGYRSINETDVPKVKKALEKAHSAKAVR